MKPSRFGGEGSPGPTVGSGSVRVSTRSGSYRINLSELGINDRQTVFPTDPRAGCGASTPISFHRTSTGREYVVIESILVGKGCMPLVNLIDVGERKVLPEYTLDHPWSHRYDVPASHFRPTVAATVTSSESFAIPGAYSARGWTVTVVRAMSGVRSREFLLENATQNERPLKGETLTLGTLDDRAGMFVPSITDNVVHLSAAQDARWQALQTPTPAGLERSIRYNMYFEQSMRLASQDRFQNALDSFKEALIFLDDADLKSSESALIPKYQSIIDRVRSGRITTTQAKQSFGCNFSRASALLPFVRGP